MDSELRKLQAAVYDLECVSLDSCDTEIIRAVEGVIKSFNDLTKSLKRENREGLVKLSAVCEFLKEQRDLNIDETVIALKGKKMADHDWYVIEDCMELLESSFSPGFIEPEEDSGLLNLDSKIAEKE